MRHSGGSTYRISRRKASSAVAAAAQQHTVIQSGKGVPCCNLIAKNQLHLETERMMLQAVEWASPLLVDTVPSCRLLT